MELQREEIDRIIEMAWEDHTPFDAIEAQFGLNESACIRLMRQELKLSSFRLWRKRVTGRRSKHTVHSPQNIGYIKHRAVGQGKLATKKKR